MNLDPQARAAIRELTTTGLIMVAACLLGIWLADPCLTFLRSM